MSESPKLEACPLCGSGLQYQFTHETTPIDKCQGCGLRIRNPQPSDAELSAIYDEHYFFGQGEGEETNALKRATAASYLDEIERRLGVDATTRRGLRLLEVGSGLGNLLLEAMSRGYEVTGLEYSESSVRAANERLGGARVLQGSLGDARLPAAGFDVAVLADVIEHTRQPLADISRVFAALRPGGIAFVAVPSLDSWSARLLRERWMEFKLEHLFYFDRQTIQTLLYKGGFSGVEISPGRKTLSADYVIEHFRRFPVPLVTPLAALGRRVLPRALRQRPISVVASGINVTTVRGASPPPGERPEVLSVVMPVFNERQTFPKIMERLLAKKIPGMEIEILIVESNSTDGTREEVGKLEGRPGVRILYEERPRGKGHAVRAGLAEARGDFVLIQDGDLEYDIDDYDALLEPLRAGRAAFVLGARHGQGGASWKMRHFTDNVMLSQVMNFGHLFFTTLFNVVYGTRLKDPFTMFKVFRRDCLFNLSFESNRFDFDWELVGKLVRAGYAPLEIPVNYESRSFSEGKKVAFFRDPFTYFRACFKYRFTSLGRKERGPGPPKVRDALGFPRRRAVLVFAAFVLALVATYLLDPGTGRVFVVEVRTETPTVAQLFYDQGDGFSEDHSAHLSVPRARVYQTLRFPLPDRAIKALRFDPADGPGTFLVRHARVEDAAGTRLRTFAVGDLVGVNEIAAQAAQGQAMRFTTTPNAHDPIVQIVRAEVPAPPPFRLLTLRALFLPFASMLLLTMLLARIGRGRGGSGSGLAELIRHPRLLLSGASWRRAVLYLGGRGDWATGLLASAATVFLLFPGFVTLRREPMFAETWALQDPVVSLMTFEPGIRVLRKEVLDHGNLLWSNLRGMGLPILGNDVQASPLFPLTLLFLPVPQPYYWNLLVVTRLVLLGLAAFLLGVRFLALGRVGALVFVFCLVYCLHVLRWLNHPWQSGFLAGLFYLYFVLRIVQGSGSLGRRGFTASRAGNVLGLAVSAYGMVTCGFPEASAMAALLTPFVALPYVVARLRSGDLRKSWRSVVVDLVMANAFGLLLGSLQIAALVEFVGLAPAGFRKGYGKVQFPGFEATKVWLTPLKEGLPPGRLVHLFGFLPAFLFLVGFARRMSAPRRLDWRDGAALLCGGFYLAKNFPVWPAFNDFVGGLPILRESWFIVYFLPILLWFFAFYAAAGMQWWIGAPLRASMLAATAGLLVLVGVSDFLAREVTGLRYWQILANGSPYDCLLAVLLAFLVLGLLGPKTRTSRLLELSRRAAMLLLLLVELILMHPGRFRPLPSPRDSDDVVGRRIARVAQSLGKAPYDVRVNDSFGVYGSSGIATVDNGAMAILPRRLQALRTHLFVSEWDGYLPLGGPKFPNSWDLVGNNLFHVANESELVTRFGCHTCEVLEAVSPVSAVYWNPNALPRAYLPARCVVSSGLGESLSLLTRLPQYQPGTVFVETGVPEEGRLCQVQSLPSATAVPILEDSGSVVRLAEVKGPAILVLNDNIYPGWTARDEATGRDLPIRPANVSFRAVVLDEPRPYRIRFAYRPRWLAGALIATLVGGAGVLLCLARALRRDRPDASE